jgi:phenylalanyl-tRNA synthetase alpha chain
MSDTELKKLQTEILQAVEKAATGEALESLRVEALGKKGKLTEMMKTLGSLGPDERKAMGAALNEAKNAVTAALEAKQKVLAGAALAQRLEKEKVDVTLSARPEGEGRIHPLTQTTDEIVAIFAAMGFKVAKGPEIETDWNNFTALNLPPDHPARQMQDTFYMPVSDNQKDGSSHALLRPCRFATMLNEKPPIRIIAPGRTYRCDYDMTHTPMFHQFEGFGYRRKNAYGPFEGMFA